MKTSLINKYVRIRMELWQSLKGAKGSNLYLCTKETQILYSSCLDGADKYGNLNRNAFERLAFRLRTTNDE